MSALPTPTLFESEPIGPGRLVLVVGPSGAGKDSVIAGAKALCARDEDDSLSAPDRDAAAECRRGPHQRQRYRF